LTSYIDEDLAYFLGAIVARGVILRREKVTTITIFYPFRNLEVEGITKAYKNPAELSLGLDRIVNRLIGLGFDVRKQVLERECQIVTDIKTGDLRLRLLNSHLGKRYTSYREFHIPKSIFNAPESIKKEFMRGYADVAGHVRQSNRYIDGRHRVYIDVLNDNWHLPVELCTLLQDHLNVPVQTIDWGHPNTRDSNLEDYKAGRTRAWAREHQIKVFADAFVPIGFYIKYKNEILTELAEFNRREYPSITPKFCIPPKPISKKPRHPAENDQSLPPEIRGKHFDAYWQICEAMGCLRCKQQKRLM